uniref:Uncharacterized protein n=1 Tax=Arundo donax TaxID=35708 RepID=A0A0A9C318_ARUDO
MKLVALVSSIVELSRKNSFSVVCYCK